MRTKLGVTFLLCCISLMPLLAQRPSFYIVCVEALGDTASKYINNFERLVEREMYEAFPCARLATRGMVEARLQYEKQVEESGGSTRFSVCAAMNTDFQIYLYMVEVNASLMELTIKCVPRKTHGVLFSINKVYKSPIDYQGLAACSFDIVARFIEKLSEYEICPFRGEIHVTRTLVHDSADQQHYSVYCNGSDQQYQQEYTLHKEHQEMWNFQKTGLQQGKGTLNVTIHEEEKVTEENGCHPCAGGRAGGRVKQEKTVFKASGSGVSQESRKDGQPQDDVRIELLFQEKGVYYLRIRGASRPMEGVENKHVSATGTCDNIPAEQVSAPRKLSVPLEFVFGPYTGKASDKELLQKDTIRLYNPVTHEEITFTIAYSLLQWNGK
jgi:hypothetical protein